MDLHLRPVSRGSVGWAADERLPHALFFWDNFLGNTRLLPTQHKLCTCKLWDQALKHRSPPLGGHSSLYRLFRKTPVSAGNGKRLCYSHYSLLSLHIQEQM